MEEKKGGEAIYELAATCPEGMQRRGKIKSDRRLRAKYSHSVPENYTLK